MHTTSCTKQLNLLWNLSFKNLYWLQHEINFFCLMMWGCPLSCLVIFFRKKVPLKRPVILFVNGFWIIFLSEMLVMVAEKRHTCTSALSSRADIMRWKKCKYFPLLGCSWHLLWFLYCKRSWTHLKIQFGTLTGFDNKEKQSCPMVFLNTFTIFRPNMAWKKVVDFKILSCSSSYNVHVKHCLLHLKGS